MKDNQLREYAHKLVEADRTFDSHLAVVREIAAQARREALEEAAQVVETSITHYDENEGAQRIALRILQERIRALAEEAEKRK